MRTNTILIIGGVLLIMILMGRKVLSPRIEEMAKAIMDFEGWSAGSVSQRNNNPGNLKWANQTGAIGMDQQGHVIFESFEAGWNGLINQLKLAFEDRSNVYTSNDTLYDFFGKYAEANSEPYAEFVANRLGVNPGSRLNQIV